MKSFHSNGKSLDSTTLEILKSLPFGVYYCDRNLIVQYINEPYAHYLGLRPEDIIGHSITEFIPTTRAAEVMQSGREELYQKSSVLTEKSGQPILVNRIPVRNPLGQVIGFISQLLSTGTEDWSGLWQKMDRADVLLNRLKPASLDAPERRGIVGSSPQMEHILHQAALFAATDEAVLILGPTGAGKELLARAIQQTSPRAAQPFVCVNCASISREFIRSELFGYAPGAFTGAQRQGKAGLIEAADGGTLFLDEIGDLPLEAQGVLLRVLENRQVQRLNSLSSRTVDFRLISATNRDLRAMCREHRFREDLYFRLSALTLSIPPLKERTSDIPELAGYFLGLMGRPSLRLEQAALDLLCMYDWPGNIRELRNILTAAALSAGYGTIRPTHLPQHIIDSALTSLSSPSRDIAGAPSPLLDRAEKETISRVLEHCGGNVSRAARLLGLSRTTLYVKMKRYGLAPRRP